MKLGARDVAGFLAAPGRQAHAVLLYGPDSGLVRERARRIATAVLGKGSDPLNHIDLTAEQLKSDPVRLRDELGAMSLMGGRRLVSLRDAGDRLAAIIESALEGPGGSTYLIVEAEELSAGSLLRNLFEQSARLACLACYRDEGRGLEDTIRQGLASHGLRTDADALQYLMASLGNDRGITQGELSKIALYCGSDPHLSLDTAMRLVGHNASESLEDICYAVAGGDSRKTERLLARLLHEGSQPVAIVRALLRHFQRLELAQAHVASGHTAEEATAQLRPPLYFKYVPSFRRTLSLWNARDLARALKLLLETERELKSNLLSPALVAGHALQLTAQMAKQR